MAAGVGAHSADAAVVHVPQNADVPATYNVNLGGDASVEFTLSVVDNSVAIPKQPDFAVGAGVVRSAVDDRPDSLAIGTLIGPGSDFIPNGNGGRGLNGTDTSTPPAPIGHFNGIREFIGVQFLIGSNTHYGYVEYEGGNGVATGHVFSIGWEDTPDTGIAAGAGIPEPTSLALLAAGAAGMGLYRGRRRT